MSKALVNESRRGASSPLPRALVGKMAAVLMVAGAVVSGVAEAAAGHFHEEILVTGGASLLFGALMWYLPWEKMGSVGTVGFFIFGVAALILGDAMSQEEGHVESVPVFVMALFAWNGLAHRRWTSLKLAPAVLLVYLVPLFLEGQGASGIFGLVFTLPFAVLVGEAIAWIAEKLTTAENEALLLRQRQDFLTSAQHELRTPLTAISGYARMLKERSESFDVQQRKEFADSILRGTERMQGLLKKIEELENVKEGTSLDLKEMGLLAAHYGDGEIDFTDPLRGANPDEK